MAQVLVIGGGGREHAICWKLAQSDLVAKIYALPGSHGISLVPKCTNLQGVNVNDYRTLAKWCSVQKIDLVVVGPEQPLANGIGNALEAEGIRCFGPSREAARIESDKAWSKDFMVRHDIPTAKYENFTALKAAQDFIRNAPYPALVVKAAGLASGKGVVVATTVEEACSAAQDIMGLRKYGEAGTTIVIEEVLDGEEVSVLAFVDATTVKLMLPAQDHKRLRENDEGPNTGGMGAYCPCPLISDEEVSIVEKMLERVVAGLRLEGMVYRGVLYAGVMLTKAGPKILEFNCRFGDPETQVILPLLESDLYEVMSACCDDTLRDIELEWQTELSAAGVIVASGGYPTEARPSCPILGLESVGKNIIVFHSAVTLSPSGHYYTNGGRILIMVAVRSNLLQAARDATKACRSVIFDGDEAIYRVDIARKAYRNRSMTYRESGVDIDAGEDLVQRIKPLSRGTHRLGVMGGLGSFGGLFRLNELDLQNPVICEAVNSIGSKISIGLQFELYESIGYDLLAMCVNDALESGAQPVAFLDYIACGKLHVPTAAQIIKGIAEGCREAKCALLGGETAEMPSVYQPGQYDLAGYCVGVVEYDATLPKEPEIIQEGDLLIALPASGLHCCGFTGLLPLLAQTNLKFKDKSEFGDTEKTFAQTLSEPTRIYVRDVLPLIQNDEVKAVSHVTHGLLTDIERILPEKHEVVVDFGDLVIPDVFAWLVAKLGLSAETLLENLNCGIGMLLIVDGENTTWRTQLPGAKVLGVLRSYAGIYSKSPKIVVRNFVDKIEPMLQKFGGAFGSKTLPAENTRSLEMGILASASQKLKERSYQTNIGRRLTTVPSTYEDPILVMGTDGVGTKIKIAQELGIHATVGIDLVAMCANDILCNGAEPYTFATYYASGERNDNKVRSIMQGVIDGAEQATTSLVEAHVTEMPLVYGPKVFDLGGFSLGIAEMANILPKKSTIKAGDVLIGLPSSGLHSNGFSLVHALMKMHDITYQTFPPYSNAAFGTDLLKPTKIYVQALQPLMQQGSIKAMAHITGGGLTENIPRVLNDHLCVLLDANAWNIPPVFAWLAKLGKLNSRELLRTFNCGIGMVLVVDADLEEEVLDQLQYTEGAVKIGEVRESIDPVVPRVCVQNFALTIERIQREMLTPRKRVAVLISGAGTNLQALIDATRDSAQGIYADIALVISNKPDVQGLQRATRAGVPCTVIRHGTYKTREEFDAEISKTLEAAEIDLVCLAGFMRILSNDFVRQWRGRLINIHPSLLPKFPGIGVQKMALDAGEKESGCTVHFVDEGVDTGRIILQAPVPIYPDDTVFKLTERIHKAEHFAYPKALRMVANGTVTMDG